MSLELVEWIQVFAAIVGVPSLIVFFAYHFLKQVNAETTEQLRKRFDTWEPWAAKKQLTHRCGSNNGHQPVVRGDIDGVELLIRTYTENRERLNTLQTHIRAHVPRHLTIGLYLERRNTAIEGILGAPNVTTGQPAIDRTFSIRGDDQVAATAIMRDEAVVAGLLPLLEENAKVHLDDEWLSSSHPAILPNEFGPRVDQVVALAKALAGSTGRAARQLAEDYDLEVLETRGQILTRGTYRGFPLLVRTERPADGQAFRTTIQAGVPSPLPANLHIERIGAAGANNGLHLGDPILDATVVVQGQDRDAIAELLCDDDLRGDLLAVVHGHEGSYVKGQVVVLRVSSLTKDSLEGLVEEAVTAARALDRRAKQLADGALTKAVWNLS